MFSALKVSQIRTLAIFVLLANASTLLGNLNNGLVAYFPLDGNASDLVSGATGTIHGASSVPNRWGMANSAFSFDGTDDYIEVPYQSSYSSNLFSFSLWVNPSANSSSYQSPFTFRGLPTGFMLYKDSSNTWSPWVGTGSTWGTSTNLGTITLNEWVFIVCTYNGTAFAGYKNGSLVSTSSPSFAPNTSSPLRIGAGVTESTTPNYFFNGKVDELRFYNRALSDAEIKQLHIIDNPHFKDVNALGYTYVDENLSNGGPWALLGYATDGNFTSKLTVASGQIDEGRQGSAVLNALSFAQSAPKLAITWTNNGSPKPNGGIDSYDHGVAFEFTDPSLLTLTAGQMPSAGSGLTNWSTASTDSSTVLLNLEVIRGSPNLPGSMYARRETFGAMYGNAYGFAKSSSNAQLDWTVDGQAFNVLYLGLNGNNGYVAPGDGGNANGYVPSTMAIWGQLETAPYDLRTSGNLSITENSDAGTMVDQFTASDNNDNNLSFSMLPVLPSEFSPVLWLDANDSSTFSPVNGKISQWQDKSGNNYHYSQSDSTKYPSYSSNSLNGLPSITFDGNDFLTINSRLGFAANPDISVFAVTSFISNIASDNRIFQLGNNSHSLAVAGGSGSWSWRFNGGNEVYSSVVLNSVGQQAWVRQQGSNYAASQFFINGTEQARVIGASDGTVPSDTVPVSYIGAGASAGAVQSTLFSNVKISELIVLNDSSEISRKVIETYLARKWGLNYPHATSNGIFELESNGTLKSLVALDRETNANYPIVVRVTDTNGNFIDQNFSVSVLDDGQEDTDGDGFLDSIEISSGSNENNASSVPADLPGFLGEATLWLDATNVDLKQNTTLSNGGSISQWKDQSGNGKHLTVINTANSPVLNAALVNSKDVVSFTGDSLKTSEAVSVRSILAVHKTLNSHYLWDFRDGVANSWIYSGSAGSYWNQHVSNGVLQSSVNGGLVMNNQLQVAYFTGSSNGSGTFYLHSRFSNNEMGTGDICELMIFNRLLNQQEIDSGEAYLAKKWGLGTTVDSDSDGFLDSVEYDAGSDPESNSSIPGLDYGLLLWYPLDGNISDMSGNARHATLSNVNGSTAGFVDGKILKALDFDGVDDFLSVPHDNGLDLRRTMSLSLWLKLDTIPTSGYSTILYKGGGNGGSTRTYSLWLENGSRFIHATSADSTDQQTANSANSAFTNNSWMHLVMLLDRYNGTIRAFKDKALVANGSIRTTDTVSSSNPLLFGTSQEGNSDFSEIDGQMDDIRLYERVLYSFEIENLYDAVVTDTDSDGLNDAEENLLDTNRTSSDTDGDGLTDFEEVMGYHTYEQINGSYSWTSAKADAENRGGYLATITSLEEKNKVETIRSSNSWLGASDTQTEGTWQWVTGEPWSYNFWASGEPNGGSSENYLITWTSDGRWNDGGGGNAPYILEREYVSNPNSQDTDGDGFPDYNETQVGTDPSSATSSLLHNDLIAHWKFDETSGTTASDSSGNNYHATLFNAGSGLSAWASGKVDGAIQLDGVDDYLAIQNLFYNQVGQIPQVTVSVWVKTTKSSEGIVMSFDRSEYWRLSVGGSNNNGRIMFGTATSSVADLYGQTVVSDGAWHMITASYSNGTGAVNFYVDGVADGSATAHSGAALGSGTTRFGIFGANNEDASYNTMESGSRDSMLYQGLIDDARIYNRALSANEVYVLHELGSPTTTPETNAAPVNLSLNHLQIDENEAVGSTVGQFSATDPDGDAITFQLVNGAGDSGNSLFSLETNGTLKTAVVFDYENNATTYSIRARASDTHGASVEGNFTISLLDLDDTAPIITINGSANITHEAGSPYIDVNASWSDAVDGSGVIVASGEVNASEPGTYVLSFNYTDAAGNAAQTVTRTVLVVDTTAPIISLNGDGNITHEAGTPYIDANASWSDAVDGFGVIVASGEVIASEPGTYVLSFNYTDAVGNAAQTVTRTVLVVDTTAPIISLNGDGNITHEAGTLYIDANASWSDAVDGFGVIVASGEVNASVPGTYVLSFNYTDAAGNAAQAVTRTVVVMDTTAPVISLHGDANITHEAGNPYIDANASWSDAVDGMGVIVASGEVNASDPGTYLLSFNYTDTAGNAAQTVTRTVHVVDTTAPVISLHGDANITHEAGNPYIDANASWSDAVDGLGVIVASGEVNTSVPGLYVLTFNYTDDAGNTAEELTRKVEVINLPPMALEVLGDGNLSIYENEPNGTIVGVFQGMDPNPGYTLSYSFAGIDESYQSFEYNSTDDNASQLDALEYLHLDPTGTLTTLRSLDYEVDPVEIPILIRVTDQFGAYFEKLFIVSVQNVVEDFDGDGIEDHYDPDDDGDGYEDNLEEIYGFNPFDRWNYPEAPIIRTLIVEEQNETLVFGAQILSSGGIENIEVGILIFDEAGVLIDESIRSWEMIDGEKLFYSLEGFTEGQNIRYQAYAQNLAGTTMGQFLEYRVGKGIGLGKWWAADLEMDGGWRESTWLGIYLPNSRNDWIYHLQLGWLYVQGDARGGLWLWMPEEKWLWTKESVWPFLWSDESAGWLYPIYSNGNRYFYDYISQGIR